MLRKEPRLSWRHYASGGAYTGQPADECECGYLLTTVRDFVQLTLEEVDVGLEAVSGSHLDGKEVMAISLGFLARGVLCEEDFSDL